MAQQTTNPCHGSYRNHIECQKTIALWIDQTVPLPNFDMNRYIQNINAYCVDSRVSKFIADYAKFQRITLNYGLVQILCKMTTKDFKTFIDGQLEKHNDIIKQISNNHSMLQNMRCSNHFNYILANCSPDLVLSMLLTGDIRYAPQETKNTVASFIQNNVAKVVEYFENRKHKYDDLMRIIGNCGFDTSINAIAKHITKPKTDDAIVKFINFMSSVLKFGFSDFIHIFIACDGLQITKQHLVLANFASSITTDVARTADVIDMFIMNGLAVTKELAIYLAEYGKYINNFEKYGIPIDDDILRTCYAHDIQVYSPSLAPPSSLLLQQVIGRNAGTGHGTKYIESIMKNYVNSGAKFDKTHFVIACRNKDISFLNYFHSQNNNAKFDDDCLDSYYTTDIAYVPKLIANNHYKTKYGVTKPTKKTVILNDNVLTTFNKSKTEIVTDKQYNIKPKPKTMLEYKKETIAFDELINLLLKYLIKNKYAIGQYFIISGTFANLLGVADGIICQRQQLDNIASHFVL